jgi:transcription-repair coupling factor (superfamily II helicase)
LVEFGYDRNDSAAAPGQFSLKGDVLDIWLSTSTHPIRLEFFGDEIESIKRLVPGTAQSIGQLTQLEIYPATTLRLTEKTSAEAIRRIYGLKTDQLDALPLSYLQHIEAIRTCQQIPELEL